MDYYKFTNEDFEAWNERRVRTSAVQLSKSKKDTFYYSVNQLGIVPLMWQMKMWDLLDAGKKRIIVCTPRQIGKSLALSVFALKAIDMNVFPSGVDKRTRVGIISATEEQSKKLMSTIRELIVVGDKHVELMTGGKVKGYFSNKIDKSMSASNNKSAITFTNGNQIICLPPTNRVRGYSFSYLFIDEGAFVEDNSIFFDCFEPTVSTTNGTICITSTPNGQQGFFYELFDPEDKQVTHEYERVWINYRDIENKDIVDSIEQKKINYYATGKEKHFEQEYEAKFTVQVTAFFESSDVDKMFQVAINKYDSYEGECDLAIDFGMVNSHTVITVCRYTDLGCIERIYSYRYPFGTDDHIIEDIRELKKRFNIQRVIPDDCAEGYYKIQEMVKIGWRVTPMSFKAEKLAKYSEFRSWLRQGKIKSFKDPVLEFEMKGLQEEESVRTTKIHKPSGGTDDMIDSFVMACYHYLERGSVGLKVYDW